MKVQIGISGQLGIIAVVLAGLSGCGTLASDGRRVDYGSAGLQVPALEIPPDLTAPSGDGRYQVPRAEGESAPGGVQGVATYSDYRRSGKGGAAGVLPDITGVHIERSGAQRWLVVHDSADNVWQVVRAFWLDLGLLLESEDKTAGVMETKWSENRGKIVRNGRNPLSEEFEDTYIAGERDQYRARLERSKNGTDTEVYITHRGIQEKVSGKESTWVARASDPELEAIMLQRLMVRFGAHEAQAASAVAATRAAAVPEMEGKASLREIAGGGTIIAVNEPFDRAWRMVGLALESAGLAIEDKDREKGIYFLRPVKLERSWSDKLMFWKGKQEENHFRVLVAEHGNVTEVSISGSDGAGSKASRQMLDALFKAISQQ